MYECFNILGFKCDHLVHLCFNNSCFSSFTIYYMNALVIKASPLYILKQMLHVSNCFRFSSWCLWKKNKVLNYRIYSQSTQQFST